MKLRNKKTGEIGRLLPYGGEDGKIWVWIDNMSRPEYRYNSLAELNEEWEDYEEPKTFWAISWAGEPEEYDTKNTPEELKNMAKQIGNYFDTREEAEKAVEKPKAWKRLKDKGFEFTNWEFISILDGKLVIESKLNFDNTSSVQRDLEICFGGEE